MTVTAVAAGVVVLLMSVAGRYGWHRDELYFLAAGHHLAWGYVDQPPFTPLVARIADLVAPGNLFVLRSLPALATAGTVLLASLIARELGGRQFAQIAASAAVAGGGFVLGVGHLLSTAVFDLLAWMALLWIFCRLLRTADPRWWCPFGTVAGLALLNKNLVVLLAVSLLAGLVIERQWSLVRTPWILGGAATALAVAAPHLIWQAHHGWVQVAMARALAHRLGVVNRVTLLPLQVLFLGPALIWPLGAGSRWLYRSAAAEPLRPLLWAWVAGVALAFVSAGRPYYILPLTTVVMITGLIAIEHRDGHRSLVALLAINAITSIPLALPVAPPTWLRTLPIATVNEAVAETVGWPQLVDQTARVVATIPPTQRAHLMLLTGSYGEAGAIDLFGPSRGLPPAYSPHNSYPYFRQPTDETATVVAVRLPVRWLTRWFAHCTQVGAVDNGLSVTNEVQGQPIVICNDLKGDWSTVWPQMRFLA